jgi:hypothetical protein
MPQQQQLRRIGCGCKSDQAIVRLNGFMWIYLVHFIFLLRYVIHAFETGGTGRKDLVAPLHEKKLVEFLVSTFRNVASHY